MKIGLLTFVHSGNFGANLQCFALQHILESLGHDVDVINLYRPLDKGYSYCENDKSQFAGIFKYRSYKDYRSKLNKFIATILNIISLKGGSNKIKKEGFVWFQNKYIHLSSEEYRNFSQLYMNFPQYKYTHLITGSDQVWNYTTDYSIEPFFLTFANTSKKISYAASVGHPDLPFEVKVKYRMWIKDFTSISVREESAMTAIKDITEKTVVRVLDPTLLIDKKEWLSSLEINISNEDRYVLVYMLSLSEQVINFARNIAKLNGCKVKIITSRPYHKSYDECVFLRSENPKSFVELYSNALYVVTNSFHGTAFAINFNIPFVTIDKKSSRLNNRKKELLELLRLEDRYYLENEPLDIEKLQRCNFIRSNEILKAERSKSISFLNDSLL